MSLVVLRVRDLEQSKDFYQRLGLALTREKHGDGPEHLSAAIGETVVELYPIGGGGSSAGVRLGLEVADLHAVLARIGDAAHVKLSTRNRTQLAVTQDPDGHTIELHQHQPTADP